MNYIMSFIIVVVAINAGVNTIILVRKWLRAISLTKKHGMLQAGKILCGTKDPIGPILVVCSFGDKWFRLLMAIPVIGIILANILLVIWTFGHTITLAKFILIIMLYLMFGWMINVLLKSGMKAMSNNAVATV